MLSKNMLNTSDTVAPDYLGAANFSETGKSGDNPTLISADLSDALSRYEAKNPPQVERYFKDDNDWVERLRQPFVQVSESPVFVSSISEAHRTAPIPVFYSLSFIFAEIIPTDLSGALSRYKVKNFPQVERYLKGNNDLVELLRQLSVQVSSSKDVASIELELYHDIEEHWEKLYVTVNTQIEDMDKLDVFEDYLYSSFFAPKTEMLSGRVVFSIEW